MKARALRKELNNTGYAVSNGRACIKVGSPLCSDLFSVHKETLHIRYALDTFHKGREYLVGKGNEELLFIWDKLHELVESGKIKEFIDGEDEIENPLVVYSVSNGELVTSHTDKYGWPNTTSDGTAMYDNTHFADKKKAIAAGISEEEAGVRCWKRAIDQIKVDLKKAEEGLERDAQNLAKLKALK